MFNKKNLPLISVVIPSRVDEEIESLKYLKKQTYSNLEIIVIYDKHKEGAGSTRNKGIEKAKGKYIFFCDNDIRLKSDAIENLYNALEKNPEYSWAFGKFIWDNTVYNNNRIENKARQGTREYVNYFEFISVVSLVKSSAKPKFDKRMTRFEDWDLWITLDEKGHKGIFVDRILFQSDIHRKGKKPIQKEDPVLWKELLYQKHSKVIKKKIADIIIPHHDRHDLLKNTLDKLPNDIFNIIIVSGGSFAENCNKGAKLAETDNLIFLNDDVEVNVGILKDMVNADTDIVGCAQKIPRKTQDILYGIGYKDINGKLEAGLSRSLEETHIPSGFCFRVKKKVWESLKGFDEAFENGAEDQDLGFRILENKYSVSYITTPMIHHESQSEGRHRLSHLNQKLLHKIWNEGKLRKLLNINSNNMAIMSTTGVQRAVPNRQEENTPLEKKVSSENSIKLELGGKAPVFTQGDWQHLDIQHFPHTEYTTDSFTSIPLEDKEVEQIFAKRTIQKLNKKDVILTLKECFRVLEPMGGIKFVVVDIKKAMGKYLQTFEDKYLDLIYGTQKDKTEFYFYGYLFQTLKQLMLDAGFINVRESIPSVEYFDPQVEFIIEADKPKK